VSGSVWWVANGGEWPASGRGALVGTVDARFGADTPPLPTTARAALYTAKNPLAAAGGRHLRGRPEGALAQFIASQTCLDPARDVLANAHRPDDFRGPPTVVMLAAQASGVTVRTLGHLRRGEAIAPDLTAWGLIHRGHAELQPDDPASVAARLLRWGAMNCRVVVELDPRVDGVVLDEVLALIDRAGIPWGALVCPGPGAAAWPDKLPVWSSRAFAPPAFLYDLWPAWREVAD
jgi:hypothetical protein